VPGTGKLRFIEVKGRVAGADTITVTRNEILYSLNKPDDFILAIVEFTTRTGSTTSVSPSANSSKSCCRWRRSTSPARAVIFAQMVDDPSGHPDLFPTEKKQEKEPQRLFRIIEEW
jgi:hypothetical protein